MAHFFSLGGGGGGGGGSSSRRQQQEEEEHHHQNPTTEFPAQETIYWYKSEDAPPSYRGFELWNHGQQQQQQEEHFMDVYGGGCRSYEDPSSSSSSRMRGRGGISCQDCGNKAKKDCPHMRCRTCCKSRGFHCQTHIKSTWVSAPKRRDRLPPPSLPNPHPHTHLGLERQDFPAVVSSAADFRCVRMNSMDEADEQLAYQTAVNIGGHVFKGILYDQGPDFNYTPPADHATAAQPLNLIAGASVLPSTSSISGGAMASPAGGDPSSFYAASLNNPFMPGGSST